MAVYRKKQPARRPVRRGWKRHARTGMFLFAFALVVVTVGVILPHAGVMSAAAEGSTLTEKIFTTVQNKNLPVIAIDPGHGGTDPGSEGSGLWEYEMTWQVAQRAGKPAGAGWPLCPGADHYRGRKPEQRYAARGTGGTRPARE